MSRFGLRKKFKQALGIQQQSPQSTTTSQTVKSASSQPVSPNSPSLGNSGTKKQSTDAVKQPNNPSPSKSGGTPPSEQDEKIAKHRKRTKVALLNLSQKSGGTASLGDLHDLAERRYFIAHKAFSDLMEEMVAEGVFLYDWSAGEATVTELGKEWIDAANQEKAAKRTRKESK